MSTPYNCIVIVVDSLRRDHVGCYGNSRIQTPNIDRLASESVVFDNAYPEALPTLPIRTSMFTGQRTLWSRAWQPLVSEDVTIAEILSGQGYATALVTDTYHMFKPDMNFHRGFDCFRWIRGQEADAYETAPHGKDPARYVKSAMRGDPVERIIDQYLKNTAQFTDEEDYFAPRVAREAIGWLARNASNQPFFLWVDFFDPHEPWDPPGPFDRMYTDAEYRGPRLMHPKYGPADWLTPDEIRYMRGLYAGEVTYVDKWVGRLLTTVWERGLHERSVIVLLADHGLPIADHGSCLKTPDNLYNELLRIPFMIRHPGPARGTRRVRALAQTHDLAPTLLDLLGARGNTEGMHGHSLVPVMQRDDAAIREYVVVGYHEAPHRCVRTTELSYVSRGPDRPGEVYDLAADPEERRNLFSERRADAERLGQYLGVYTPRGSTPIPMVQLAYEVSGTPVKL
jgi:arylsulfatase A-like enzyme